MLVFAQREASLHWLSHATQAATAKHSSLASSDICDECASIASLGAAVHPDVLQLPVVTSRPVMMPMTPWASAVSLLQLGYASRGPPSLG
jgi:hypothetical protein